MTLKEELKKIKEDTKKDIKESDDRCERYLAGEDVSIDAWEKFCIVYFPIILKILLCLLGIGLGIYIIMYMGILLFLGFFFIISLLLWFLF